MYFTERFNADILHSIVENERNLRNKLYFIPDRENDPFLLAKKILRNSEDGKIKVIHRQINNQGRRVAAGGLSLANLARQLRHAACIDIYIDIDVENAHPVILRFICNQHKIDCEFLDEYVEDREKLLSEFEDREAGKKAYLTIMNGADGIIECIEGATRHLKRFSKEMETIRKQLIKDKKREDWATDIKALANHGNVLCKLSGMVTEADWNHWNTEDFETYLSVVFDAFGEDRLMFGSDWPVCLLAASYPHVLRIVENFIQALSPTAQEKIMGLNAQKFYNL